MKKGKFLVGLGLLIGSVGSVFAQTPLIVELRPGYVAATVAAQTGTRLLDTAPGSPFYLFRTLNNEDIHVVQDRMALHPGVVFAEDNVTLESPENSGGGKGSSVAVVGNRSNLFAANANFLGQIGFSESRAIAIGRTVRVGILDTGLAPSAAYLWSRTVGNANFVERNRPAHDVATGIDSNGNNVPNEGVGHGTFVAGLLDLVAPRSSLVICRIADSDGVSSAWQLVKGLAYATANRCEVINVSMGSIDRIPAVSSVLEWVQLKGALVVAPVGNRNQREVLFPAGYSKCLSVAGVDQQDRKTSFSNFDGKVNSCAPASGLFSTWDNGTMGLWSGTSFASPLMAGAIADCLKRREKAFPYDLRVAAIQGGNIVDAMNPDYEKKLGRRLNINLLDLKIRALVVRP